MGRETHHKRWSIDNRARGIEPDVGQSFINSAIKAEFLDIDKQIAWTDSMILDKVICKRTETGWLMMVKAHRNSRQVVAYLGADSYAEAYELVGEFAARGCLTWRDDAHPPKLPK